MKVGDRIPLVNTGANPYINVPKNAQMIGKSMAGDSNLDPYGIEVNGCKISYSCNPGSKLIGYMVITKLK